MVNQQSGQNMIMVLNGACSHITPEDVRAKQTLIEQADVLLVQMEINVDALEHVIRIAHESGVRVILNPAPVQKIADEMMAMVDTVTPNETEAAALTGVEVVDLESAHRAARVLLNKGVRNVVITLGGNGVYCTDGTREELIDRIAVDVVDTTGAGDAFNGGILPPRFQTEWSCLTRFAMETAPARFPSPSRVRPKPCLARRKSTRFIRHVTADEQPFCIEKNKCAADRHWPGSAARLYVA